MAAAGRPVRYFCTAGRGLEPFVAREARARLGAAQVEQAQGKVFFSARARLRDLRALRAAERLFLLVRRRPPLLAPRPTGTAAPQAGSLACGWAGQVPPGCAHVARSGRQGCAVALGSGAGG